jgi:hypothetical protein
MSAGGTAVLSQLFVHLRSMADSDACALVRDELRNELRMLDERDDIAGYRMAVVKDQETVENELLDLMFDCAAVVEGRFPFVYVLVTPHEPARVNVNRRMRALGFKRFA